jgi:hypothetical protein
MRANVQTSRHANIALTQGAATLRADAASKNWDRRLVLTPRKRALVDRRRISVGWQALWESGLEGPQSSNTSDRERPWRGVEATNEARKRAGRVRPFPIESR